MQPDVPQQPPLEVVKQGSLWVVEEFRRGARTGETFATLDTQLGAVRFAKSKLDDDAHPCVVRWDTPRSVGDVYWNPLFERVVVRYDPLLNGWSIVPDEGTCAMSVEPSREAAADRGTDIQRAYDFKQLRVYGSDGARHEDRDHRFIRFDITRSGVTFDPEAVAEVLDPEPEPDDPDEGPDEEFVGPASPGQLGASIPDVTKVEFTDTDGAVHRYSTPWGDGTSAQIITVSSKYATDAGVPEAFAEPFERWQAHHDTPHVASVYESGTDPTSWAAYRVGTHTLADIGTELPPRSRVEILGDVADAATAVADASAPVCGLTPGNVHLLEHDGDRRATVANWGIEWSVREAVGLPHRGEFLAPEQHEGRLTSTADVYQLGAIAHWLLCGERYTDGDDVARPVETISPGIKPVVGRALDTDPGQRYDSARAFYRELLDSV